MASNTALTLDAYTIEKLGLLGEMLRIAQTQLESIAQDRPDELLQSLRKRERIIRRIDNLDASFRRTYSEPMKNDSSNNKIRNIAASILDIDRQCEEKAGQRLMAYKADLKSIAQSAKQLGAYANPFGASQGIYLDTKK